MTVQIAACDPASSAARAMGEALWEEIQRRYGFTAPYPFDPADYAGPVGGFCIALLDDRPVGSVALAERADGDAELDVMYVAPDARGAGVAQALLAAVGGLEHAAIAGFLLGGAALRVPVVLDGVIAGAAALLVRTLAPTGLDYCFAGHRSAEPGHAVALDALGLTPLIDLGLRLGEGTGAVLALPLLQCAARALRDMATFDSAGVANKDT